MNSLLAGIKSLFSDSYDVIYLENKSDYTKPKYHYRSNGKHIRIPRIHTGYDKLSKMEIKISKHLTIDEYKVNDRVLFVENIGSLYLSGIFGTVSNRYLNDIGLVVLDIVTDKGETFLIEWTHVKAIRKVIHAKHVR